MKLPISSSILRQSCASMSVAAASGKSSAVAVTRSFGPAQVEKLASGITVASLESSSPLDAVRISAVFNAGARHETYAQRGLTHLLQRSAGLSTNQVNTINLVRTLQQIGAGLQCANTRDHLIYTVECLDSVCPTAIKALAVATTQQQFYHWELSDMAKPLVKKDTDLVHRLHLDKLMFELLHEAAFRDGLGRSIFCSPHMVNDLSSEMLHAFTKRHMTGDQLTLVGVGLSHPALVEAAKFFQAGPVSGHKAHSSHYKGGELRHSLPVDITLVGLGFHGASSADSSAALPAAILARVVGSVPGKRIRWGSSGGRLAKFLGDRADTTASAFNLSYSDDGLIGLEISGRPDTIGETVKAMHKGLVGLGSSGIKQEEFDRAKAMLKADIMMTKESFTTCMNDTAVQVAINSKVVTPDEMVRKVDALTLDQVNQAAKKIFSSKVSMASVGNLATVPYVDEL